MPRPPSRTGTLVLALLLAGSLPPRLASANHYYALVGGVVDDGATAPRSVGPLLITGGVGSSGTGSARADLGRMTGYGFVSNPISGLFTPQIDARTYSEIDADDMVCPECPAYAAEPYPLIFHTRLTGHLSISGAHPYGASIRLTLFSASGFQEGYLALNTDGVTSSGLLTGVPTELDTFHLDIPVALYLAPEVSDILYLSLETRTGGTAFGTEVNTAEADFLDRGWEVEHVGPVFGGLPEGLTLNIPSLNVFDNHWLGPSAEVSPGMRPGMLALVTLENPARGERRLSLTLPASGEARVEVFGVSGARVATLLSGWLAAGTKVVKWDASTARAGIYFARVSFGGRNATTRVVVLP